ncbi:MAG: histidine kinase [Thermoleophilaceae bacterium]
MIDSATTRVAPPWRRAAPPAGRVAIAAVAFVYGLLAVTIAARHGEVTTYAGSSAYAEIAELAAGWTLVTTGLLLAARRDWRHIGAVVTAAGLAWFAGDWTGWEGGPAAVRSIAFLALGLAFAFAFDAVATWGISGRAQRVVRGLVMAVYAEAVLVAVARALFRDPFEDPHCWSDCTSSNTFLAHGDRGIARALDFLDLRFAIASGLALAVLAAWRIATAGAPGRRRLWPVLVAGGALGLVHAGTGVALVGGRTEDPQSALFAVAFGGRCAAAIALAGGLLWALARARGTRAAIARLVEQLGELPPPGAFEAAVARAVGDPSLRVAYRLSGTGSYVDREGQPVDATPSSSRAATAIVRKDEAVAVVLHDPAAIDEAAFVREISAAATLAVDNERLAADARAQLVALTASRARIVAIGDAERRRLERDLHDGAQQRLLALSYDLRVARASADAAGDVDLTADLDAAVREAEIVLDELRTLAHGIYPAVLEESGLAPALKTLAVRAPLSVELGELAEDRLPDAVERAAYVTVAEAVSDAAARGATFAGVGLTRRGGRLVVTVRDDGAARVAGLPQVADRLGALRGSLDVQPTSIEAEIPCGW